MEGSAKETARLNALAKLMEQALVEQALVEQAMNSQGGKLFYTWMVICH